MDRKDPHAHNIACFISTFPGGLMEGKISNVMLNMLNMMIKAFPEKKLALFLYFNIQNMIGISILQG